MTNTPEPNLHVAQVPLSDHGEINRMILSLPWEVQKQIVTIAAHCAVLADPGEHDSSVDLAGCISHCCFDLAKALATPIPYTSAGERVTVRWRHKKRGSVVTEIGRGRAQAATGPIEEMAEVVVYEHDENIWVRSVAEFEDGRFEAISSDPPSSAGERMRERLAQLQAAGCETLTIHQVVGLISFCESDDALALQGPSGNTDQPVTKTGE